MKLKLTKFPYRWHLGIISKFDCYDTKGETQIQKTKKLIHKQLWNFRTISLTKLLKEL